MSDLKEADTPIAVGKDKKSTAALNDAITIHKPVPVVKPKAASKDKAAERGLYAAHIYAALCISGKVSIKERAEAAVTYSDALLEALDA